MGLPLENIMDLINRLIDEPGGNYIAEDAAVAPEFVDMKIFESPPLIGVASSDDKYFERYQETSIIGRHFIAPREWLPEARSVVSVFFHFAEPVRESNIAAPVWPSSEWLHGRIEGQAFIAEVMRSLRDELVRSWYPSVAPSHDPRFLSVQSPNDKILPGRSFTSVWSERHIAFACGLGTFGLSKGLITKKGIAGRFGSIVTALELSPTERAYSGVYDYCTMCGACVRRCPAKAITIEKGKNHSLCAEFVGRVGEKFAPRYGCGKCQVGVPCQGRAPGAGRS